MKKFRFLSWLLCLSLLFATLTVPGTAAVAEETSNDDKSGMVFTKKAEKTGDKEYTITLEAYATGEKVISEVTKDVPTDIILVLDQSGSMDDPIGTVSFAAYSNLKNSNLYDKRHNGGSSNLWHKLEDDSYVSVSVTKEDNPVYTPITNGRNNRSNSGATNYWSNSNNLYALVKGEYLQVKVTRTGNNNNRTYTYTLPDGTVIATSQGDSSSPIFGNIDGNVLYLVSVDDAKTVYTYTYTDANGNVQTIGTSTGDDTRFSPTLYQRSTNTSGGGKRVDAIKSAATTFVNSVAAKAAGADGDITTTADNINHRIAVVGFASQSGYGDNTELLSIRGRNSGNIGVAYNNITDQNLKDVMQDMSTSAGKTMVSNAINALATNGATRIDLGLDMAERILKANPVSGNEQRNRVVIVFTDGSPTNNNGFQKNIANSAITTSDAIKALGATVYSIGVFSGADATSAGTEPSGDLGQNSNSLTAACNWFMQKVSSNNGTPQRPSYYLSASDSGSLSSIFKQISDQIETGGSSTTLDENTVIKDIISPSFVLPEGTTADDITLETYKCTGKDAQGNYTWENNNNKMGATAEITTADITEEPKKLDQVNVTGFDFAKNYVGTVTENGKVTYRGNKLVIKIKVTPRSGFFGGNDVTTNESAGVYKDAEASDAVKTVDSPKVNVPLATVEVVTPDANVYLGAHLDETVSEDDVLKNGAKVSIAGSELKFGEENYGLAPWQNEYVQIEASASTDGSFENMTEDTDYTVTVKVTPKTGEGQSEGKATGKIHVFKPELTFQDSVVEYKKTVVTGYEGNKVDEVWKSSDGRIDDNATMLTSKPTLTLTYTPKAGSLDSNGLVISTEDIPVKVDVALNGIPVINEIPVTNYTTFVHQNCGYDECEWTTPTKNGDPAFLLHVINVVGDLTITKTGLNEGTYAGTEDQESAIFRVTGDKVDMTVVVNCEGDSRTGFVTIANLPAGEYTVTEISGWTWRYTADAVTTTATVEGGKLDNSVVFNNDQTNNKWLGGDNYKNNVFGSGN